MKIDYGQQSLQAQIAEATLARDASKLDLALRAQDHYNARGRSIDTTNTQYPAVLDINPKFYG